MSSQRALFVGDRSETLMHAHHAVEICVALDELGVDMRSEPSEVRGASAVVVSSNSAHAHSIPGPKVAVLYVDPASPVGASLERRLAGAALLELAAEVVGAHQEAMRGLFWAHFTRTSVKMFGLPPSAFAPVDEVFLG